jgi:hypothetical protein
MAETIGSLVDKITIVELKRFHMQEQIERADATDAHRQNCVRKLQVLTAQRDDLAVELDQLAADLLCGLKPLKVYRQFKMYNDPIYRRTGS